MFLPGPFAPDVLTGAVRPGCSYRGRSPRMFLPGPFAPDVLTGAVPSGREHRAVRRRAWARGECAGLSLDFGIVRYDLGPWSIGLHCRDPFEAGLFRGIALSGGGDDLA